MTNCFKKCQNVIVQALFIVSNTLTPMTFVRTPPQTTTTRAQQPDPMAGPGPGINPKNPMKIMIPSCDPKDQNDPKGPMV